MRAILRRRPEIEVRVSEGRRRQRR